MKWILPKIYFVILVSVAVIPVGGCSGDSAIESHKKYTEMIAALGGEISVHLEFSGPEITDDDLVDLPFADTVRSISLRNSRITDRGAAELKRAKNLQRLNLVDTQITDNVLDHLKEMPHLLDASVYTDNISGETYLELNAYLRKRSSELKDRDSLPQPVPRLPAKKIDGE